jgi:hypothetical protein
MNVEITDELAERVRHFLLMYAFSLSERIDPLQEGGLKWFLIERRNEVEEIYRGMVIATKEAQRREDAI